MSPDPSADRRASSALGGQAPTALVPPEDGQELVYRDDLTGLHNRRALNRLFSERWPELLASRGEIALLILDLDLFKDVNDTFGHLVGDEVLQRVARLLRGGFRDSDLLVRYGGDEFVVALPGAGATEARALAERTREQLAGERFSGPSAANATLAVSFSIGVASAPSDGSTGEQVLHVADRRLYDEKRQRQRPEPRTGRYGRFVLAAGLLATLLSLVWMFSPRGPFLGSLPVADQAPATVLPRVDREGEERLRELQAEVERLKRELAEVRRQGESGVGAPQRKAEIEGQLRALAVREAVLLATTQSASSASRGEAAVPPAPSDSPARDETAANLEHPKPDGNPPVAARGEGAGLVAPIAPFSPPELVSVERPAYPAAARRLRRTAVVELRVRIDETGRVVAAETLGEPAGLGFDSAAREAALHAVYRPARRNGVAVPGEARLTVRFDLEGKAEP